MQLTVRTKQSFAFSLSSVDDQAKSSSTLNFVRKLIFEFHSQLVEY